MLSKQTIITTSIASILLFIVGFQVWGSIFMFILPRPDGVVYTTTSVNEQLISILLFSFTLALIPVGTMLLWNLAPIRSTRKRALAVCIIVLGIIISVFLRRELVKFVAVSPVPGVRFDIPLSQVKFDFYAMVGLVVGCVAAYFLLKEKPRHGGHSSD